MMKPDNVVERQRVHQLRVLFLVAMMFVHQQAPLIAADQSSQIVGNSRPIDVKNALLLDAIAATRADILTHEALNPAYVHRIERVVNASSQVVAGLKFDVTLRITQTSCVRAATATTPQQSATVSPTGGDANCPATRTRNCRAKILIQVWLDNNELLSLNCDP